LSLALPAGSAFQIKPSYNRVLPEMKSFITIYIPRTGAVIAEGATTEKTIIFVQVTTLDHAEVTVDNFSFRDTMNRTCYDPIGCASAWEAAYYPSWPARSSSLALHDSSSRVCNPLAIHPSRTVTGTGSGDTNGNHLNAAVTVRANRLLFGVCVAITALCLLVNADENDVGGCIINGDGHNVTCNGNIEGGGVLQNTGVSLHVQHLPWFAIFYIIVISAFLS
jgi:hypothetical protein